MIDERIIFECSLNVHSFLMPLDVAFVFINLSFNTKLLTNVLTSHVHATASDNLG